MFSIGVSVVLCFIKIVVIETYKLLYVLNIILILQFDTRSISFPAIYHSLFIIFHNIEF